MPPASSSSAPDPARDPRVFFAAQRTMLAWVRTGVALMGFGFVVARFGLFLRELAAARNLPPTPRVGASLWAGVALLLIGVATNAIAAWRYKRFEAAFTRGEPTAGVTSTIPELAISSTLALLGMLLAAYLLRAG
jgi:putative membrane protein